MTRRALGSRCGLVALAVICGSAGSALASSGVDSPDNGVEQVGRGNAWVARADDPLAVYYNPATLPTQASGVHVGLHLMFLHRCFTRVDVNGKPVSPGDNLPGPGAPPSAAYPHGGPPAEVCAKTSPFPNPQLAGVIRITDDLAVGLAVLGPHGVGNAEWPETVTYQNKFNITQQEPAPNRYLLTKGDSLLIFPTVSVGYSITKQISVGAGFIWGIAKVEYSNFSEALSTSNVDEFKGHQDVKATLTATDAFIPGFVLGGLWQATDRFDVGAWFKWMDAIRSDADIYAESLYWGDNGAKNPSPCKASTDPKCNITDPADKEGTVKFATPMEAKLGARYHHPGPSARPKWAAGPRHVRDPLSEDLFDVEADFTWAHNSAIDNLELRFRNTPPIPVKGTPGTIPANADVPHQWKDTVGVRLGGDFVVLPSLLALRAGGFYETKAQDDEYLNLDFHAGWKLGLGGGGTVRVGPVDISAAFQHTFFGAIDNGGKGKLKALSGDVSTGSRSQQIVNGGKLTSSLNEVALGGTLRF